MSLFSSILEKLGFKGAAAPATSAKPAAPAGGGIYTPPPSSSATPVSPAPITVVDVVGKLEGLAAKSGQKLDWKVSIVDLLKLLGLDSSVEARKELAIELGCPADKLGDSAKMNTWLHKTVLQRLAQNGGNIPKDLLD